MFFKWFNKKTSLSKLKSKVEKTHLKEWQKRLDIAVKEANKEASLGKTMLIIPDKLLRCPYNTNRKWDDILSDVQKRFQKCKVFYNSIHGQTVIEVRWNGES